MLLETVNHPNAKPQHKSQATSQRVMTLLSSHSCLSFRRVLCTRTALNYQKKIGQSVLEAAKLKQPQSWKELSPHSRLYLHTTL